MEYAESHRNYQQCVNVGNRSGDFPHTLVTDFSFDKYEQAEIQSPNDIVPACAVPQSRAEPHQKQAEILSALAENRHVQEIISEKRA